MRCLVGGLIVMLLALPAVRGDDTEKPPSPEEQYQELTKKFNAERSQIVSDFGKAKGEEQNKLRQKYFGLGKEYAGKFFELAEKNPKDPVATDALFWILQNGDDSPIFSKAVEKAAASISDMPLKDLKARLRAIRTNSTKLLEAVAARAEKADKDPAEADLLAWVAMNGSNLSVGEKAIARLVDKYPDNPAITQVCMVLSRSASPKAIDSLKTIMEKSSKNQVKATAALAIAGNYYGQVDKLQDKVAEADKAAAEAAKYYTMVIEQYAKDSAAQKKQAEKELKALKTTRVGKVAPIITAPDLDEKEFKLSDYRGKVVLLDFWGNW